ncbi:serine/threonine-protein kinase [Streptomyces sp. NPDC046866]|uniref:serine/threonine-protein kinase n=1 Tax=Streptomyces sp. NPDC046866 TaxID=3154921 RepID=UPI0034511384
MGGTDAEAGSGRVVSGRYRLLGLLGRGGMGTVWRARDEVLGREVAVKEVRAPAGLDGAEVGRLYRRLEREAWAAARVAHRGVVTVYDVVTEEGRPWIVMELVRGLSLAEVLEAEGPLTPQRAAHIGEQLLAALRSAHEAGVLHRDVKPANVLLANDGRVVLGDFGIARLEGSSELTVTGEVVGSPEFLAPERALGRDPGPASDLWSLGVLLYAAVEGVSPFRQDTPLATLRAVVDEELPPPRRAGPLAPVLEGLLRKDPDDRLPAAEAARMLRVIGAGGAVRDAGGPVSGPDSPTAVAHHGPGPGAAPDRDRAGATPPLPLPAPLPGPGGAGPAAAGGSGRAGAVLAAGIIALLLAVAVLAWLLFEDGWGTGGGGSGGHAGGAATSAPASAPASASDSASAGRSGRPSASSAASVPVSPSASAPAAPHVTVTVHAVRAEYRGSCPPAPSRAPAFTGTVRVDSGPAALEYRWATRSGVAGSGTGWQPVGFTEAGPASRESEHTALTYYPAATFEDAVRLEVRGAAQAVSEWVEYSVTCEKETPTGGASSPGASGSPAPVSPSPAAEPAP